MFKEQCPSQSIPDNEVCTQIADVFFKLAAAHKAYGEAAEGIAELASRITPEQYTVLLDASAMPTIQVVVPGQMVGPLTHLQSSKSKLSQLLDTPNLSGLQKPKSYLIPFCQNWQKQIKIQPPESLRQQYS